MVRKAEAKDTEEVLGLIKEFHKESINAYDVLCDDTIARQVIGKFLDTSFVLELDNKVVGVFGGMITNYPLNNKRVYLEWIWYVLPKYRLHGIGLYNKVIEYCKENDVEQIIMVLMANLKTDKLDKFYKRLGFELLEKHYIKNLGA